MTAKTAKFSKNIESHGPPISKNIPFHFLFAVLAHFAVTLQAHFSAPGTTGGLLNSGQ
jgi:hypothetical protein